MLVRACKKLERGGSRPVAADRSDQLLARGEPVALPYVDEGRIRVIGLVLAGDDSCRTYVDSVKVFGCYRRYLPERFGRCWFLVGIYIPPAHLLGN